MLEQEDLKAAIVKNYGPWHSLNPSTAKLQRMMSITNATFKAEIEGDPKSIICRVFGESKENLFLSRQEEIYVYLQMAKTGDGPKIYYYDEKIRLQEFIDSTVLHLQNMLAPESLLEVAYTLAQFHKTKPTAPQISKQNSFRKSFLNVRQKMLAICNTKLGRDIFTQEQKQIVAFLKTWVTEEQLTFLQKLIDKYESEWELVFSHNDLLRNNILIRNDNGRFVFIDYQYAAYNFPFYDIAYYFEESQISFQTPEPPFYSYIEPPPEIKAYKLRFLDAYVVANDFSLQDLNKNFEQLRKLPKYVEKRERLAKDLGVGRLLCNLSWGWWAIIDCKNQKIQFDHLKFAKSRYENYLFQKKALKF